MSRLHRIELNRYQVLILFIISSAALFYLIQWSAGCIYLATIDSDIFMQFYDVIVMEVYSMAVFLIVLFAIVIYGTWRSHAKQDIELVKGFKFSLIYSCILLIVYIIFLFDLYVVF